MSFLGFSKEDFLAFPRGSRGRKLESRQKLHNTAKQKIRLIRILGSYSGGSTNCARAGNTKRKKQKVRSLFDEDIDALMELFDLSDTETAFERSFGE